MAVDKFARGCPGRRSHEQMDAFSPRRDIEADGAKWTEKLTPEYLANAATDFHIFPNTTVVPVLDGALWHRMRPNGDDPSSAIWDILSLERYPSGKEPAVQTEYFATPDEFNGRKPFLEDDVSNMAAVPKCMVSRRFRGGRTNPVQELTVSNFHRVLYERSVMRVAHRH